MSHRCPEETIRRPQALAEEKSSTMVANAKRMHRKAFDKLAKKLHEEDAHWLAIFRVFPFVRAIVALPAGMIRMPHKKFIGYSLLGFVIWSAFWILLGFYFGMGFVHYRTWVWVILAVAFVVAVWVFHKKVREFLHKEGLVL